MLELVIRYVHFLGILALSATLVAEKILLQPRLNEAQARKLFKIDAGYGISAVIVLISGLTLWLLVGKPAAFYYKNWIFLTKIGVFAAVGLLSIVPTRFFAKSRKLTGEIIVPASIDIVLHLQLVLLAVIPLLAVLMARGVGL